MKKLNDIYEIFRGKLLELNSQSKHLEKNIEEFADTVLFLPAIMVKKRLLLIEEQILLRSDSLVAEHNGKGWVFVMKSDKLLSVYWFEKEFPPKDKDDFRKRGNLILSMEEITELIDKLLNKVDSGQFAEAGNWVNRYEPSFINNQVG